MEVRDDRNTLVHGKLIRMPSVSTIDIKDISQSKMGPFIPFFRSGEIMVVRNDRRVPLKASLLHEIDQKVNVLLHCVYEICEDINPLIEFGLNISIDSDAPSIHFGDGRRTTTLKGYANLRDLLNSRVVNSYRCSVCNFAEIVDEGQQPAIHCDVPMNAY